MSLPKYSNILVPTDGSECSFYAAGHAVYLAKECGAKIYALNAVNAPLAFHAGIHYAESFFGISPRDLWIIARIAIIDSIRGQ